MDLSHIPIRLHESTLEPWRRDPRNGREAAVLMSGGVDSSVTAMLLQKDGWNVLGLTMNIPMAGDCAGKRSCCGTEAAYVCRDLGIPHYFVDVREAFERAVIEPFRRSYAQGWTPSPCADCNAIVKFRLVWELVERSFGITRLATGHYARVLLAGGQSYLARAADKSRDQSYFLYGVALDRLEHLLLPVGELDKDHVRELARAARLPVARRPDSMELCFAAEGDYRKALGLPCRKGSIKDAEGNSLGEHDGIAHFTVGQRRGLGIASGRRLYVTDIDARTDTVMVGNYSQTCRKRVDTGDLNVLILSELETGAHLRGKIRSHGEPAACTVRGVAKDSISVEFDEPQFAPAPGQRLVLYDRDERVVCGGTIRSTDRSQ